MRFREQQRVKVVEPDVKRIGSMPGWSFLTNHAIVLIYLAKQPGSTVRQIASGTGISDKALRKATADLSAAGYITKKREGRESQYSVSPTLSLLNDQSRKSAFIGFLEALRW